MAILGGTDAFCHIVLLYSFSRLACDSFVKVYNFKLKFIFATSATFPCKMEKRRSSILLEWRYLCMRSLLRTSRCKRVKLKLGVFLLYSDCKKKCIFCTMQRIRFSLWTLSFWLLFLLFMKIQSCIAREKFFHFPLSLLLILFVTFEC